MLLLSTVALLLALFPALFLLLAGCCCCNKPKKKKGTSSKKMPTPSTNPTPTQADQTASASQQLKSQKNVPPPSSMQSAQTAYLPKSPQSKSKQSGQQKPTATGRGSKEAEPLSTDDAEGSSTRRVTLSHRSDSAQQTDTSVEEDKKKKRGGSDDGLSNLPATAKNGSRCSVEPRSSDKDTHSTTGATHAEISKGSGKDSKEESDDKDKDDKKGAEAVNKEKAGTSSGKKDGLAPEVSLSPGVLQFNLASTEPSTLEVRNEEANNFVAIKLKSTDPAIFRVEPVFCLIEPGGKRNVQITRLPNVPAKADILEVVVAPVDNSTGLGTQSQIQAVFKNADKEKQRVVQVPVQMSS